MSWSLPASPRRVLCGLKTLLSFLWTWSFSSVFWEYLSNPQVAKPALIPPGSQPRSKQHLLCFDVCFPGTERPQFPTAPGGLALSLVSTLSHSTASHAVLSLSPFPDCFLACTQAIRPAFLNNSFSSARHQSNFVALWNFPNHFSHQNSLLSWHWSQWHSHKNTEVSLQQESRNKGVIHSFNKYLLCICYLPLFYWLLRTQ